MTLKALTKARILLEALKLPGGPDFSFNVKKKREEGDKGYTTTMEDLWLESLSEITDKEFMKAIGILIKTNPFFPKIPQIIKAANSGNILIASEAWEIVQEEMDKCMGAPGMSPGKMTPDIWKAIKTLGGLDCIWTDKRDQSFIRNEFIKIYNQIREAQKMVSFEGTKQKRTFGPYGK